MTSVVPEFPEEFFGDEKKSSFEKLAEKFPDQVTKVVTESVKKIYNQGKSVAEAKVVPPANKIDTISMEKFGSSSSTFNIQIKDGQLSHSNGPIQMLDKDLRNMRKEDETEAEKTDVGQLNGKCKISFKIF